MLLCRPRLPQRLLPAAAAVPAAAVVPACAGKRTPEEIEQLKAEAAARRAAKASGEAPAAAPAPAIVPEAPPAPVAEAAPGESPAVAPVSVPVPEPPAEPVAATTPPEPPATEAVQAAPAVTGVGAKRTPEEIERISRSEASDASAFEWDEERPQRMCVNTSSVWRATTVFHDPLIASMIDPTHSDVTAFHPMAIFTRPASCASRRSRKQDWIVVKATP